MGHYKTGVPMITQQ
jgi:hypothetical protein